MIPAVVIVAVFAGLVFLGVRWQTAREHQRAAETELRMRIGRRAVVTEPVTERDGLVRINGEGYAARSADGDMIGPRRLVEVVDVQHGRLLVRKVAGQSLLIDVDHMVEQARPEAESGSG